MQRRMAISRLFWKEWRQLLPLVGLLLACGAILQTLAVLLPAGDSFRWREWVAILGMPGLFAAGAGALLVGQEKETRSLDWLRSLPLPARDLVGIKTTVAVLGLLLVWGFSLGLGWITGALESLMAIRGGAWLWPLHSFFLLTVGLATAWSLRSSLHALLWVVPLACLPVVCVTLHHSFLNWQTPLDSFVGEPSAALTAGYLVVFCVGFAVASWQAGLNYLAPERGTRSWTKPVAGTRASLNALAFARISPAPALLWQYAKQNRGLLLGLIGVQLFASLLAAPLLVIATLVVVSWLGALVFQSDTPQRRALFLADRGVSPGLVWLTRQAWPWALLTLGFGVFALFTWQGTSEISQLVDATTLALLAAALALAYLIAQWLAQLSTSQIVSAIAVPLVAAAGVAYFVYCFVELEAPWWTLGVALLIPPVATWSGTRDWLDGRRDRWMWGRHASFGAVFALLPIGSFLGHWASLPRMSAAARERLTVVANEHADSLNGLRELQKTAGLDYASRESLRQALAQDNLAVSDTWAYQVCLAQALLLREGAAAQPSETGAAVAVDEYREWLQLLLEIHERFRLSWRLREQDQADVIEIWLLEELQATAARDRLGDALLSQIAGIFANSAERDAARLRAIALSLRTASGNNLGGYAIEIGGRSYVSSKQSWGVERTAGVVCELLLQTLEADPQRVPELRERIAKLMGRRTLPEQPLYLSMYQATSQGEAKLLYSETVYARLPGTHWRGAWEEEGRVLAGQLLE